MSRETTTDSDELLIIRAACAPSQEATAAWSQLHSAYGWDHIPHSVARFLPMIYLNTRGKVDVPDSDRLRGVYRASWASNLSRIAEIRPVLEELRARGVEATVIKGSALCILSNQWGLRRMGDVDVVMPPSSARVVHEVLEKFMFARISPAVAGLYSDVEGPWRAQNDTLIDVHFNERWNRYAGLSADSTETRISQGFVWTVPTPEAALAIALEHGQIGAGAGDDLQTTLDLHLLSSMLDRSRASELLGALDLDSTAVFHAMRLESALGDGPYSWIARLQVGPHRRRRPSTNMTRQSARILLRRVREWKIRRMSCSDRLQLWQHRREVNLSYWVWLESGMLGPLERLLSRAGVAPDPSRKNSSHATENLSMPSQVDISVLPRRDLRTRFNLASRNGRSRIRIILPRGLEHRRFLYVGGRCMGLINPSSQPVIDIDLDQDLTGSVDVSLRLYWDVKPREKVHDAMRVDWADI